ncbi:phage integrase central domain-containing protein [Variovorax sp.]|uniref:phage integrase central domain-containing protein n=1 Tax=Variovorax sp. TaxID=1871043 RepID=UPI003BAC4F1D
MACERFIAAKESEWLNPKHRQQWENTLKDYAEPVLGHMDVAEIGQDEVLRVLDPIWRTKTETATARDHALGGLRIGPVDVEALAVVEHGVELVLPAHRQRVTVEHVVDRTCATSCAGTNLGVADRPVKDVLVFVLEGAHCINARQIPAEPVATDGAHLRLERHDDVERRHPLRRQLASHACIHQRCDLCNMLVVRKAGTPAHPEDWIRRGLAGGNDAHGLSAASSRVSRSVFGNMPKLQNKNPRS